MACLIVIGAVLYLVVVRSQDQQLTQSLTDAVATAGLGNDTDHDHDLSQPRGGIQYAVLDHRGLRQSADLPPGALDVDVMRQVAITHRTDRRTVHLSTGAYDVLTAQRGDDTVQVIASRYEQHQERERILGALAVAGGAGLILATSGRRHPRPSGGAPDGSGTRAASVVSLPTPDTSCARTHPAQHPHTDVGSPGAEP